CSPNARVAPRPARGVTGPWCAITIRHRPAPTIFPDAHGGRVSAKTAVRQRLDTVAYLEAVADGPAHLVGWSDGAVVALLVAQRRPDLVGHMVLIGQYYNSSGRVPGSDLNRWLHAEEAKDFLRRGYDPVSPDGPGHFPVVYAKTLAMIDSEPELDLATLGTVSAPTLVLQGDRDEVTLGHGAAVSAALGNARLAVLPGTHALPLELPDVVNPLLIAFLRGNISASRASAIMPL